MDQTSMLNSAGEDVRQIAERLDRLVESIAFTGPAAERFRLEMQDRLTRLRHAAQELQDVAGILGAHDQTH